MEKTTGGIHTQIPESKGIEHVIIIMVFTCVRPTLIIMFFIPSFAIPKK